MSKTEQLTVGPVWSGDTRMGSSMETTGTADSDQETGESICRTIELFPTAASRPESTPRLKKRARAITFTEGLAILMLTAATCIALFAAIGYLCR